MNIDEVNDQAVIWYRGQYLFTARRKYLFSITSKCIVSRIEYPMRLAEAEKSKKENAKRKKKKKV